MGGKEKPSKELNRNPMERYLELFPPIGHKDPIGIEGVEKKASSSIPTIDLHGMTQEETRNAVIQFLRNCRRKGIRRVLIIHGKGYHSTAPAVLGTLVKELLKNIKEVEDFGPAPPQQGGSGATWVLLRQRSR
ncbi:MAG: Smr/MutS family protein [Spirochaetes bacterium]|nr:Smr/MutS family protein [Spirochaetota bacterium]